MIFFINPTTTSPNILFIIGISQVKQKDNFFKTEDFNTLKKSGQYENRTHVLRLAGEVLVSTVDRSTSEISVSFPS